MKSLLCTIAILIALAGPPSLGQTHNVQQKEDDEVLAQGNPPLTLALSHKLIEFFEWTLDTKFTKAQRALFTMKLLPLWEKRDQASIDAFIKMRKGYEELANTPKENRDKARDHLQSIMLEGFPKDPPGSLGEFLLSVYSSSHPEAAARIKRPSAPAPAPVAMGGVPPELVGEWVARRGSGGSYVNPNTGQTSAPNATIDSYKIFANGTYEHGMLMQSSLYNCTTTIFGREVGPITVQGSTFTITPQPGTLDYKSSCSPSMNELKQTNFPPKTMGWRVQRGEFGLELCLQNAEGQTGCYLKQ